MHTFDLLKKETMKNTICLVISSLLLTMGCSNDDNTPPAPKAEPYKFDESVIKDPASTIACARMYDSGGFLKLVYQTSSSKSGCPDKPTVLMGDPTDPISLWGSDTEYIKVYYDGGLRINMSFNLQITARELDKLKSVNIYIIKYPDGKDADDYGEIIVGRTGNWNYRSEIELSPAAGALKKKDGKDPVLDLNVKSGERIVMAVKYIIDRSKYDIFTVVEGITFSGSASFQRISQTGGKPSMINFEDVLPSHATE